MNFVRVLKGLFSSGFPARVSEEGVLSVVGRRFNDFAGLFCNSPLNRQAIVLRFAEDSKSQ